MKTNSKMILILAFILSIQLEKINSEGVYQGRRLDNDILLHRSVEEKGPNFYMRSSDIAFPRFDEERGNIITAIIVTDNLDDGGSAEIDYGGVGHTFANVHLRSKLWGGLNFTVEIYGIHVFGRASVSEVQNVWNLGTGQDFQDELYEDSYTEKTFVQKSMRPSVFMTVKRYYCSVSHNDYEEEAFQLLYGTNGWRFPTQDVNLTLSYPTVNKTREYIITSMEVILYFDGKDSKGCITSGGIHRDSITMTYIIPNITRLSYQFWVRGIAKSLFHKGGIISSVNICPKSGNDSF